MVTPRTAKSVTIHFIEPMFARPVEQLPTGKEWLYEVKFDGYRCMAGRDITGVTRWSRRGNILTDQFPAIVQRFQSLPPQTLFDGEVVALDEQGRISFNMLQHHRSKAQALQFYAFDVLIHCGKSLLNETLTKRRDVLMETLKLFSRNSSPVRVSDNIMQRQPN